MYWYHIGLAEIKLFQMLGLFILFVRAIGPFVQAVKLLVPTTKRTRFEILTHM